MTPEEREKADREAVARHKRSNRRVGGRKQVSTSAKNDYVAPRGKPRKKKKAKAGTNIAEEITSKKKKLKGLLDRFGLGR